MTPTEQTEKNIREIHKREKRERGEIPTSHKVAHAIADFVGTIKFAVLNALFFALWMVANLSVLPFDPYPFTLLITIVSLEAIFLSIIVLISQNELSRQQDRRNNLDLQVNLLLEQESTELIRVILLMAEKLGVDPRELTKLQSMAEDTSPEEVLQKIDDVEKENDQ